MHTPERESRRTLPSGCLPVPAPALRPCFEKGERRRRCFVSSVAALCRGTRQTTITTTTSVVYADCLTILGRGISDDPLETFGINSEIRGATTPSTSGGLLLRRETTTGNSTLRSIGVYLPGPCRLGYPCVLDTGTFRAYS